MAVSSVGAANSKAKKELFLAGYNEMLARLQPEVILFMGKVPEECKGNIVQIKAFHERFKEIPEWAEKLIIEKLEQMKEQ